MENFFQKLINYLISLIIFFIPLFFLTITSDFFNINKQYFLILLISLIIIISLFKIIVTKKIYWKKNNLDKYLLIFLFFLILSLIISSPNKIQAIINPNFGLSTILFLIFFYFYSSRINNENIFKYPILSSSIIISLITIISFFEPFKNISLPLSWQFIKNPFFSPIGSQIDLIIFLLFVIFYQIILIFKNRKNALYYLFFIINFISFLIALNNIFKNQPNLDISIYKSLPPLNISWYSAVEILKNPLTLFFGVGLDNFSSIFTKVKDISYNQSLLWQISYFNYSRSAILQIFTETGILGLISFIIIFYQLIKNSLKNKFYLLLIFNLILSFIFFPISFILWFIFFISISIIQNENNDKNKNSYLDISEFPFVYYGIFIFGLLIIIGLNYLLFRHYLSDFYFKKSIDSISKNNLKETYDNQKKAITLNPFIEKYHINFSQTNLIIANNLIENLKLSTNEAKINDQDRQNIAQAIQQSITYAKDGAVGLNPQKAQNWQNLAEIYKNIIGFAQDADVFAIASYERAIILDPQNPIYRLNLGGIHYILNKYENAINIFIQTINLKPDWPNAHYSLAWSYYQKKDFEKAINSMNNVLKLINKEKNKSDWEKANQELEMFKNELKEKEINSQLTLPKKPETIEPKINL
ncbi:MAG: hypothetical protein N2593_02880 [Patescibacteria group bacterium]|nr:hypothetical protein [Patescibacteria group bacterium]